MKREIIIWVAVFVLAILLGIYFLPLLEEFKQVELNLMGLCIGTGCYSESATYSFGFGSVGCSGYQVYGFFCPADSKKYCRYMKPFEPREKCICSTITAYKGENIKYEFMCTTDMVTLCKNIEGNLEDVEKEYLLSNYSTRINIFNNRRLWYGPSGDIQLVNIKTFCTPICANCNSTLCTKGNICEYVNYPPEQNS